MTSLLLAGAMVLAPPPAAPADSGQGVLEGTVRQAGGANPVAGAVVVVRRGEYEARVRTGRDGHYRIRGVPTGWVTVSAGRQGYRGADLRVRVPEDRAVSVHFDLRLDPVVMPAITVRGLPAPGRVGRLGRRDGGVDVSRANPGSPRIEALKSGALGGSGMVRTVRRVVRPDQADPSLLYFRGGTSPFKQVFLDGAPVHTPFHMGGLLAAYPRGVLSSSDLRSGGTNARLGGGLFYTLDLQTRSPDGPAFGTEGRVDLLGARARTEGRVGQGRYLLSARSLYEGAAPGSRSVTQGRDYGDLVGRVSWGEEGGSRVSATGFWNRESVPLGTGTSPRLAEWGNTAGSMRFTVGSGRSRLEGLLASGRFDSEIPLAIEGFSAASADLRQDRAALRWVDGWRGLGLEVGSEVRRMFRRVAFRAPDEDEPRTTLSQSARRAGAFAEATWDATPEVTLRAGLRGDYFSPFEGLQLSPRASARVRLGSETAVELSGGRHRQLIATPLADSTERAVPEDEVPQGPPIPAAAPLRPRTADHLVLRLEHSHDPALTFGFEGQFKKLHGLADAFFARTDDPARGSVRRAAERPRRGGAGVLGSTGGSEITGGGTDGAEQDLYASGVDLWFDWSSSRLAAWGTYSLTWLWSRGEEGPVSERFAARQVLTAGTEIRLPGELRTTLEAAGTWGLPFTPVPAPEPQVSNSLVPVTARAATTDDPLVDDRSTPFFRLDARLERSWSTRVLGTEATLTPYAGLLNVLDRDDALFYRLPSAGSGLEPVTSIPLLPMVGLQWETGGT